MPRQVVLTYHHSDEKSAEMLAFGLLGHGIRPWFDKWDVPYGGTWIPEIARALREAETVLVCLGPHGLGQVQDAEHQLALDQAWRDPDRRVIPVLLPGFQGELPDFLALRSAADLRRGVGGSALEELARQLEGRAPGPRRERGDRPYQALEPFREEDALRFFGRRRAVDELLRLLRTGRRFLTLVGASGSGKSSLMLAGLLPAVRSGELGGSHCSSILTMQPRHRPCHELARTLLHWASHRTTSTDLEALRARLLATPATLSDEVDLRLGSGEGRALLAVDQLEEVFTQALDDDRTAFLANLVHATTIEGGRAAVVATLRADFLGRALEHSAELTRVLKGSDVIIGPLSPDELREAVERPALQVGIELEEGLADTLVDDVAGQPGGLPLLQFTLDALWRERRDHWLSWDSYRRLGGTRGAIARRAEQLYADLGSDAEREALSRIFGRLVHFHREGPKVGRRARLEELEAAAPGLAERLVRRLERERLLTASEEGVEVAHEALIEHWPRLRAWIEEREEVWQFQEEIAREAVHWQGANQAEDWLWRGSRLTRALELLATDQLRLAPVESAFVEAARDRERREAEEALARARREAEEREREALRRLRRSRILAGVFVVLSLTTTALALWALQAQSKAGAAQRLSQQALARSHLNEAVRLEGEGRRFRALAHIARALRLDPESSAARGRVASLVLGAGHPLSHSAGVTSVSFSPGGGRVVTSSHDRTTRLWDTETGRPLGPPLLHEAGVQHAAFSPDGHRLVTASSDGTARIWDVAAGRQTGLPLGHGAPLTFAAFSPDGRRIVTSGLDKRVRVWNTSTREPAGESLLHRGIVFFASFSADSRMLLTSQMDEAYVWDLDASRPAVKRLAYSAPTPHLRPSFSADGKLVLTPFGKDLSRGWIVPSGVRVWDSETGHPVSRPLDHDSRVVAAVLTPDGKRVLTLTTSGALRVWNAGTARPIAELPRHVDRQLIAVASFSAGGDRLVTADADNVVRVWDTATGRPMSGRLRLDALVRSATLGSDGRHLVTLSEDGAAHLWETAAIGLALGVPLDHDEALSSVSFSPDGGRVVTASFDSTARLWDVANGRLLAPPLRHRGAVGSAAISLDGRRVLTASADGTARLWDVDTGRPLGEPLRHDGPVLWASFSPDGRRAVTASEDRTARLWDVATGRPLGGPLRHEDIVNQASFSPDGERVVTASEDGTARVWAAATGRPIGDSLRHQHGVGRASFSPDGERVVTASWDGTARVWEAATGRPIGSILMHDAAVGAASFSPDGRLILTASYDATARIWHATTGEPIGEPLRHERSLEDASFSPDGQRVVTTCDDNTSWVWDVATGQALGPPLPNGGIAAAFSPDGQRVVTASFDGTARIWDVPTFSASDAAVLADFAEVVSGYRVTDSGNLAVLPPEERTRRLESLIALGARARPHQPDAPSFLRWYFNPRHERSLSPLSSMTVDEYLTALLAIGTEEAREEAEEAFPAHPLLLENTTIPPR